MKFATKIHTGLLEYTIGGDNEGLHLGTNGTNISVGSIASAMAGLREGSKVMSWKYGGEESSSTLSAINYLGYADVGQNVDLSKDIWDGRVRAVYADTEGHGEYEVGSGTITLSSKLLGGGKEESAKLATVLTHEGTHYYGSRIEGIAHLQGLTTYNILSGMPGMQGDSSFTSEMENAIKNKDSWKENTGDTDYWVKTIDGKIVPGDKNGAGPHNVPDLYEEYYLEDPATHTITKEFRSVAGSEAETSGSESIAKYLGDERMAEIGYGDTPLTIDGISSSLKDIYGMSDTQAKFFASNGNLLNQYMANAGTVEQNKKYAGEIFLKSHGYTYSAETGWNGGDDLAMSALAIKDGGYNIKKNKDGTYTSSFFKATAWRDDKSFEAKMGTGVSPNDPSNYKARDALLIEQFDMMGKTLDSALVGKVQTVDVYNGYQGEINRNQPYYDFATQSALQGNTIVSDFDFLVDYPKGQDVLARITNATTLGGYTVNNAGNNMNDLSGGHWNLEYNGFNQTSDGCFMLEKERYDYLKDKFANWGIKEGTVIAGTLYSPRRK